MVRRHSPSPSGASTNSVVMPPRLTVTLTGVTLDTATLPVAAPLLMDTSLKAPVRALLSTLQARNRQGAGQHYSAWGKHCYDSALRSMLRDRALFSTLQALQILSAEHTRE